MKKIKTKKYSKDFKLPSKLTSRFSSEYIMKKVLKTRILEEVLMEARDQLAALNKDKVNASTNVVLKRIDDVLKWWGNL